MPTFDSCIAEPAKSFECHQTYDANNLDQRCKFISRLHEVLAVLGCEDTYIAGGILRQIQHVRLRLSDDSDSTRTGLAAVLLARMKANEPCPGLAGLSAEDKAELERLTKEEVEKQQAAKAASAGQQ